MARAHLIAVGSELLLPGREDTNTAWLRERLFTNGIPVAATSVIGDDETALVRLLETVAAGAQIVLLTGGLGPTEDDITKKALARCLRKGVRYDEKVKERLEGFYAARGLKMPENNLRQALVPMGARVLENRVGTAPGIQMEERGTLYFLLPGPPREMQPMFEEQVLPLLLQKFGDRALPRRHLRLTGLPESAVDQIAAPVYKKFKDIQTTILSKPGDIELIMIAPAEPGGPESLDRLVQELQTALHEFIYSADGEPLEVVVGRLLRERRLTLSVAESCTGGLLAKRVTDVPGSSAYFLGGAVCYNNALKTQLAGRAAGDPDQARRGQLDHRLGPGRGDPAPDRLRRRHRHHRHRRPDGRHPGQAGGPGLHRRGSRRKGGREEVPLLRRPRADPLPGIADGARGVTPDASIQG